MRGEDSNLVPDVRDPQAGQKCDQEDKESCVVDPERNMRTRKLGIRVKPFNVKMNKTAMPRTIYKFVALQDVRDQFPLIKRQLVGG